MIKNMILSRQNHKDVPIRETNAVKPVQKKIIFPLLSHKFRLLKPIQNDALKSYQEWINRSSAIHIPKDHCYAKPVSEKECTTSDIRENPVGQKSLVQNMTIRIQSESYLHRTYNKGMCDKHENLFLHEDDELVPPGARFASPDDFLNYTYPRGKKWMFYFQKKNTNYRVNRNLKNSRVFLTCIFRQNGSTSKGLRKIKQYRTNCPSCVIMKQKPGEQDFEVVHVCYHHDHELSPEIFAKLPIHYKVPQELRDEIVDLAALELDIEIIWHYFVAQTGLTNGRDFVRDRLIKNKKIQKKFTAAKLKTLMAKIKELKELYEPIVKSMKKQSTTETPVPTISSKEPLNIYEGLLDLHEQNVSKQQVARIKMIENSKKPKRKRIRKKRSRTPSVQSDDSKKKSRLETMLDRITSDKEVLLSVQNLQQSMKCEMQVNPWATESCAFNEPTPQLCEELLHPNEVNMTIDNFDTMQVDSDHTYYATQILENSDISEGHATSANNESVDRMDDTGDQTPDFQDRGYEDYCTTEQQKDNTEFIENNTNFHKVFSNSSKSEITHTWKSKDLGHASNIQPQKHDSGQSTYQSEFRKILVQLQVHDTQNKHTADVYSLNNECSPFSCNVDLDEDNEEINNELNASQYDEIQSELISEEDWNINNETQDKNIQLKYMQKLDIHRATQRLATVELRMKKIRQKFLSTQYNSSACKVPTDNKEEIISRHNIHLYLIRPDVSKSLEKLSQKSAMSLMDILRNIYCDKEVLKIAKSSSDQRTSQLSYHQFNLPFQSKPFPNENYLEHYQKLCVNYINTCFYLSTSVKNLQEEI